METIHHMLIKCILLLLYLQTRRPWDAQGDALASPSHMEIPGPCWDTAGANVPKHFTEARSWWFGF